MKKPTAEALRNIRGVVFDLDDTLVDSQLDFEAIRKEVGAPLRQGILEYIETLEGEAQRQAEKILVDAEWRGAELATWMPNAERLVHTLNERGIPQAILTRNARPIAQATMDRLGIPIERLLAREDCAPKPSPEGLLMVAEEWQMPPAEIVYIGDFKYDIYAALAAEMVACLYIPPRKKHLALADDHGAHWVIDDLAALMPIGH
ncbi:MAG TPA: HAD family hydrolase [Alcanivoracaceae bacterium]|nr:HAD family hydrolase [Alcanivoracaceae bacterium]